MNICQSRRSLEALVNGKFVWSLRSPHVKTCPRPLCPPIALGRRRIGTETCGTFVETTFRSRGKNAAPVGLSRTRHVCPLVLAPEDYIR
jgi:hypothetical protein